MWSVVFFVYVVITIFTSSHFQSVLCKKHRTVFPACHYQLKLTHNGPVTLDVPITFHAKLNCYSEGEEYMYVFEDDAIPAHRIEVTGNSSVTMSVVYPEKNYQPGQYSMKASAYFIETFPFFYIKVASTNVTFDITEFIPGNLDLVGVVIRKNDDNFYASTGNTINMTINMHYPQRVYEQSEMSYSWSIDDDQFITMAPYISYKFSKTGTSSIHVTAVARIPIYDENAQITDEIKYKWGHYFEKVIVKDPFYAINLTGNNYLQHGQLLNIDVSCNGSGPFEYCWKIFQPLDNVTNFTCSSPVVTNQCSFPILYYFHESGQYHVIIHVDNFVSSLERDIEVHVYDVSLRPQLSTVIIPIFCSVLVMFIIAAGVMLHVRRNQHVDIETADFDFLQSEACVVETFWERLCNSILRFFGLSHLRKCSLCITNGGMTSLSSRQYESLNE